MISKGRKQIARERREKKFRLWLTTLSWTLPVVAFGSFFSLWHSVSSAVNSPAKAKPTTAGTIHPARNVKSDDTQSTKSVVPSVLFKIGSRNPQVKVIQQQLYELGYFNHVITDYYGPVTAQAVESFQISQHLNATGEIDSATLTALQQAVKHYQTSNLTSQSPSEGSETPSISSVGPSQQYIPQTRSSAS